MVAGQGSFSSVMWELAFLSVRVILVHVDSGNGLPAFCVGKVERLEWKLKDLRSRPHDVDMFPDTLHKKMFFVLNPDNILLLESNKLTNCRLILQMLHQFPTIPNLLAALCVLLQCVIQRRNTCSVWNGN